MRTEIINRNRPIRASLLTLLTSDTANLTRRSNSLTFRMRTTLHKRSLLIGYKLNQMLRTLGNALTACLTSLLINHCHTVHNINRPKRTGFHTASESKTSECTCLSSATRNESHHLTVFHTCILIIILRLLTGTRTLHIRHLTGSLHNFLSHDRCDYFSDRLTAYRTSIYRCLTFGDCCCQTITAGITTATAVITGKRLTNSNFLLIHFHSKLLTGNAKENTDKKTYCRNQYSCRDNCSYIHTSPLLKSVLKIRRRQLPSVRLSAEL